MFKSFFAPKFQKIFGFERGIWGDHWEGLRVDEKLEELAKGRDLAIDKAWEVWREKFTSTLWYYSLRQANTNCLKAADDLISAQLLAEEAGFEVKKPHRNEIRNRVPVNA